MFQLNQKIPQSPYSTSKLPFHLNFQNFHSFHLSPNSRTSVIFQLQLIGLKVVQNSSAVQFPLLGAFAFEKFFSSFSWIMIKNFIIRNTSWWSNKSQFSLNGVTMDEYLSEFSIACEKKRSLRHLLLSLTTFAITRSHPALALTFLRLR